MRKISLLVAALLLAGCSGMQYAAQNYSNVRVDNVDTADGAGWRIFDKPAENRMMVTSSLGGAAAQGLQQGLTFGIVDATPPKPLFQAAAEKYLADTGRPECRITDGYLIVSPQFEFKYTCARVESPAVAAVLPRRARRN